MRVAGVNNGEMKSDVITKGRMKKGVSAIAVVAVLFLAGCWDRVEIENRAFAVAFGVDGVEAIDTMDVTDVVDTTDTVTTVSTASPFRFQFSTAMASHDGESAGSNGGDSGENEDNEDNEDSNRDDSGTGSSAQGQTLIEAIHTLDANSSRKLSLGQAKTMVLGTEILRDRDLFCEVIGVVENTPEIDSTITVLATNSRVSDVLTASPPNESKPGYHVVNFYRLAAKSGGRSFQKDFESMMADLRATGNTVLPLVEKGEGRDANQKDANQRDAVQRGIVQKDTIRIEGALVIKDYRLAGELDGTQLRGLLWAENKACKGAILTIDNIPMIVRRHRSTLRFSEKDGRLRCTIDVRVKGEILRFNEEIPEALKYEQFIAQEISETAKKLQQELEVDAFGFQTALRRQRYSLYRQYVDDWPVVFKEMEIVPVVRCDITSNN